MTVSEFQDLCECRHCNNTGSIKISRALAVLKFQEHSAPPASMDKLLGAICTIVQAEMVSTVYCFGSQQSPSSTAPGHPTAFAGTCSGTAICIVGLSLSHSSCVSSRLCKLAFGLQSSPAGEATP